MTVFLTPDGRPFYAGTYFPPQPRARHAVVPAAARRRSTQTWRDQRDEVEERRRRGSPRRSPSRRRSPARARAAGRRRARGRGPARSPRHEDTAARRVRRRAEVPAVARVCEFLLRHAARDRGRTATRRGSPRAGRPDAAARWPAAACTTSWRAGSRGTPSTAPGSCRTSRRCSTTTPSSPGSTCTGGGSPATRPARRVAEETCDWMLAELRHRRGRPRRRRSTPTPDGVEGLTYVWTPAQLAEVLGDDGRRVGGGAARRHRRPARSSTARRRLRLMRDVAGPTTAERRARWAGAAGAAARRARRAAAAAAATTRSSRPGTAWRSRRSPRPARCSTGPTWSPRRERGRGAAARRPPSVDGRLRRVEPGRRRRRAAPACSRTTATSPRGCSRCTP